MKTTPLRYSIQPLYTGPDLIIIGHRWQCFECESGSGSAPVFTAAHQAAQTHIRSAHTSQEITVTPKPRRRRWWHLTRIPATPRRAES